MKCPKCGSEDVTVQVINELELKKKGHSAIYWLLIGWWLQPILWIFMTLPMLIIAIFKPSKKKIVNHTKSMAICHHCGHTWEVGD